MKQITLHIPDHKVEFITKLMNQLGIAIETGKPNNEEQDQDIEIPEEHKAIVRERMEKMKEEDLIPWEEARKQLSSKEKT